MLKIRKYDKFKLLFHFKTKKVWRKWKRKYNQIKKKLNLFLKKYEKVIIGTNQIKILFLWVDSDGPP